MVLLIDNYDSFVHNLARHLRELGADTLVVRNDELAPEEAEALAPSHVVVSPGPRTPREAGVSGEVIRRLGTRTPVLGVCLGHQCIGAVFGAEVGLAERPMHGKSSLVFHDGTGIFAGIPNPFRAARYHSLTVSRPPPDAPLLAVASTAEEEVMALRHRVLPVWGVQFHPESILTEHGYTLLGNFLALH